MAVCVALGLLYLIPSAIAFVSSQDWQFTTSDNPMAPTVFDNAAGTPSLIVSISSAGAGWLADLSEFGTQTGLLDLGGQNGDTTSQDRPGSVAIEIPTSSETQPAYTDIALKVTQFVDGNFYMGDLSFSIPDAVYAGRTTVEVVSGFMGGQWVEDSFNWRVPASTNRISLVIIGAKGGTLLDRVRVDASVVVSEPSKPLIASIAKKEGSIVSITWSGGKPPYQLFRAASLPCEPDAWQPIGSPVTGNSMEIMADSLCGFIRVGGGS